MFVPTSSKIKLCALFLGSLFFLIGGLKGGHRTFGGRGRRLSVLTGLAGLLYIGLELCWYFYVRFVQSREIALAYYFSWKFWGGVVVCMLLYVIYSNAKGLLTASTVLLVAFNLFVIARHLGRSMSLIGIGDGLFGGMFIASLVLMWVDQQNRNNISESTIQPTDVRRWQRRDPMMNSLPASATTHEYRMKVSKSGLFLLLAALLMLASIRVATRGLVRRDVPTAIGLAAIGALLMLCGVHMVATVLRSRLVIEESQIRFRIVFREEVFSLSEIEGVRIRSTGPASHRVSRRVVCVRGRKQPIEVVQFGGDNFLQTWLQQFPNLDESDQASSAHRSSPTTDRNG